MQRKFTKDVGKNFKAGNLRDYPLYVWKQIARDARMDLDKFSEEVVDEAKEPTVAAVPRKRT